MEIHKWIGARLLSPGIAYTSCLTSWWTTESLGNEHFKKTAKLSTAIT